MKVPATVTWTVYEVTQRSTGMKYVGVTRFTERSRFYEHLAYAHRGIRGALYDAIRAGTDDDFAVTAVSSHATRDDAMRAEQARVLSEKTLVPGGFNLTSGGRGVRGHKWTAEQRARLREKRGFTQTQEYRDKQRAIAVRVAQNRQKEQVA